MKLIRLGSILISLFAIGFAFLDIIEDDYVTLRTSFALSFLGGIGCGMSSTSNMAVMTSYPPK